VVTFSATTGLLRLTRASTGFVPFTMEADSLNAACWASIKPGMKFDLFIKVRKEMTAR
jgi:hypothetical protein